MTLQHFLIITEKRPRDTSIGHNYFKFHEHIINSIALCIFGSASENLTLILARNNVHIVVGIKSKFLFSLPTIKNHLNRNLELKMNKILNMSSSMFKCTM